MHLFLLTIFVFDILVCKLFVHHLVKYKLKTILFVVFWESNANLLIVRGRPKLVNIYLLGGQ